MTKKNKSSGETNNQTPNTPSSACHIDNNTRFERHSAFLLLLYGFSGSRETWHNKNKGNNGERQQAAILSSLFFSFLSVFAAQRFSFHSSFDNWLMKFPFSNFQLNVKRVSLSVEHKQIHRHTHTHTHRVERASEHFPFFFYLYTIVYNGMARTRTTAAMAVVAHMQAQ